MDTKNVNNVNIVFIFNLFVPLCSCGRFISPMFLLY